MSLYTLNTLYTLYMMNNEDIDIDITTDISTCVIQYYILLVKFAIFSSAPLPSFPVPMRATDQFVSSFIFII